MDIKNQNGGSNNAAAAEAAPPAGATPPVTQPLRSRGAWFWSGRSGVLDGPEC